MKARFSPSENHRYLMSQTTPALGYGGGDVRKWQNTLRRKLRVLVGDMPKARCPLNPRTLWKRQHALGSIEKILFTSKQHCHLVVGGGGHRFYADDAWPVMLKEIGKLKQNDGAHSVPPRKGTSSRRD